MKKKLITICMMISVILVSASVSTAMNTADPDAFAAGTDLSNAFPDLILSSRGDGWSMSGSNKPIGPILGGDPSLEGTSPYDASTGDLSFFSKDKWYPHLFQDPRLSLRADFTVLATDVCLDFIGNDLPGGGGRGDKGMLEAYDAGGSLIGWDLTGLLWKDEVETLCLNDPTGIAYIIAYGTPQYHSIGIDNLQWEQIPAPGAILLGSIGISLVGWLRRRRTL
jgi:hypothetical protein